MTKRAMDLWLPTYIASASSRMYRRYKRTTQHTHIIFLVCDHFEPRHGVSSPEQSTARMNAWQTGYAALQDHCRNEFGTTPLHSWFYPPHHGSEHLASLAEMAHDGLGEVELHYHHDGDTEVTLERDLRATIAEYNRWGLLLETGDKPRASFGFIHGDWALGNSGGGKFCGVNDELTILQNLGCWADLTMPSSQHCQTRKINSIYYASGNPHQPKSHDWGVDARVGQTDQRGLMLIQGPLGINWGAPSYPRIENASLTTQNWGRPDRIRKWIDCHVHVHGRPEWLFVKLHTHGALEKEFDGLFGEKALQMHRTLNRDYNDGKRFSLHYVTARQAYNIARAAEHGHSGNPSDYLDFQVPPPATSIYAADSRHTVEHCNSTHLKLTAIEGGNQVKIRTRVGPVNTVTGHVSAYEVDAQRRLIQIEGRGTVACAVQQNVLFNIAGSDEGIAAANGILHLDIDQRCTLTYR